jgi:hypothetical protein
LLALGIIALAVSALAGYMAISMHLPAQAEGDQPPGARSRVLQVNRAIEETDHCLEPGR